MITLIINVFIFQTALTLPLPHPTFQDLEPSPVLRVLLQHLLGGQVEFFCLLLPTENELLLDAKDPLRVANQL